MFMDAIITCSAKVFTPECWTQLNETNGTISSPDYPRKYPDKVDCRWQITAEPGSRIRLLFAFFDLENNFDFLQVKMNSFNCVLLQKN